MEDAGRKRKIEKKSCMGQQEGKEEHLKEIKSYDFRPLDRSPQHTSDIKTAQKPCQEGEGRGGGEGGGGEGR